MPLFDFPDNPSIGDPAVNNGIVYRWDGQKWIHGITPGGGGGGGGGPAGNNGEVQFNSLGVFGASAELVWDAATNTLTVRRVNVVDSLYINGVLVAV